MESNYLKQVLETSKQWGSDENMMYVVGLQGLKNF